VGSAAEIEINSAKTEVCNCLKKIINKSTKIEMSEKSHATEELDVWHEICGATSK
jgi:hypothetical protein